MNIEKLLRPNRICVVGASEKEGFGGDTCRNAMKYMDESKYFFVNPKRDRVFGIKAYQSISDIPEQFDLAILCTPMQTVESLLREAKKHGASAAVVYASGYKETGTEDGAAAQESLINTAKELDMAVMGPNCAGFINYVSAIHAFAFIAEDRDRKGAVGFVSQSGQLCLSMMENPASNFSYAISAGNSAVTSMEDYIDFLVEDEATKVVAIYLEGLKNPKKFTDSLRKAAKKRKPVIVLKAGRSEKGGRVAASHTGSLAGSDKTFDALFKKFGVIRVDDLEELIYTAQLFATIKELPKSGAVASMNLSGGETGICADVGSGYQIDYPDFEQTTIDRLKELLPSYASPSNPLDMTATLSYDTEKYAEALRTVMGDKNISLVIIGYTLLEKITDPAIHYMAEAMEIVAAEKDSKPMVMLPFAGNTRNREYQQRLEKCGVCVLPPPLYGMKIIKQLCNFADYDISGVNDKLSIPNRRRKDARISLNEHAGKMLLSKFGVPIPEEGVASSKREVREIISKVGFPAVLKIVSPDILHKSDCGGVILGIDDFESAEAGFDTIIANAVAHYPNAQIDGVLIQHMAESGTEIIIGVNSDPQLGPAILVGLGGVFVEVFKDTALALAPVSIEEARGMIDSLKASRLLKGYRGKPKCDTEALSKLIVSVSEMAEKYKDSIVELDINPVFVNADGVCAVDAVVISDSELR
ncbi:MAG: acetate--CoA ligase family protein [Oscillospiraceae bacterium]